MDILVLDEELNTVGVVDSYTSIIWTDRYNEAGDFELYLPVSLEMIDLLQKDRYLWNSDSFSIFKNAGTDPPSTLDNLMVIEDVRITTDVEEGNNLKVIGRSLESVLDRRIVWGQKNFEAVSLETVIRTLLNENAINPSISNRIIPNLRFWNCNDSDITSISITKQFMGESLYEAIKDLCQEHHVGFHLCLHRTNNTFNFQLYRGTDRSYAQTLNSYVIFSSDFENIINSEFHETNVDYKNVCLVGGEENGTDKTTEVAGDAYMSGLARRETFCNAIGVSRTTEEGTLTPAQYKAKLLQEGEKALKDARLTKEFEGEVETNSSFVYGKDFFMGDIVELSNEYGQGARTRVKEFIINQDDSGYKAYPTFEDATEYGRLPTAYREVSEIRSNNGAYLDTGLKGINGFDISFSNRDTADCSIFGAKDNNVIEDAVDWAIQIANDRKHGYSQYTRWGPDYDCSSFVISAYEYAGVPLREAGASYTGDMYNTFTATGFSDVTGNVNIQTGYNLKRGDVLFFHVDDWHGIGFSGHAAMYIGDGKMVHAASDERGMFDGWTPGDQTDMEIFVEDYHDMGFGYCLRYTVQSTNITEFSMVVENGYIKVIPDGYSVVAANGDSSVRRNIKYGGNTLWAPYLNEVKQNHTSSSTAVSTKNTHLLFAEKNEEGNVFNNARLCIQHARFFKSSTSKLVMDLVPCVRKSDNVIGMYDLCGNICPLTGTAFFINAGTGSFSIPT